MRYTELDVWQRSIDLVVSVYDITSHLPSHERFGLSSQMRRAAVSVPSNIAEGEGRRLRRDETHFFVVARGSLYELHTQVAICVRLGYVKETDAASLTAAIERVAKLINGTLRAL